jgi:uncharacterized protein (DUF1015 family)
MATIRPFRGLRFSKAAGNIDDMVAPPYDVLSKEERDAFAAKNRHNIVHLTLPEQHSDDRNQYVKYTRSASTLADWTRDGSLALENQPAFYRYTQTFKVYGIDEPLVRTSIIALIKVEPYEKGVVLAHEQTFPKHKEDRLRILEATRAHLECIFGLFEDQGGKIFNKIATADAEKAIDLVTDDGVRQVIEPITDPETCKAISDALSDKKVWIADGHHRFETACNFRAMQGEKDGLIAEDFMMMALSSMSDPGLALLPTHRTIKNRPMSATDLKSKLGEYFSFKEAANNTLFDKVVEAGDHTFGIALPGGTGLLATLKDPSQIDKMVEGDGSLMFKSLDVTILHKVIFEKMLDIQGLDLVGYTRNPEEAMNAVNEGYSMSFIMNAPTVEDMRQIALGGEKMPQKSTFYYPKILSGLVVWSLANFEA